MAHSEIPVVEQVDLPVNIHHRLVIASLSQNFSMCTTSLEQVLSERRPRGKLAHANFIEALARERLVPEGGHATKQNATHVADGACFTRLQVAKEVASKPALAVPIECLRARLACETGFTFPVI